MHGIKATVRHGRVETEMPIDLPEGTEVYIVQRDEVPKNGVDIWEDSPEGLKAWNDWVDSLDPLVFTADEEAELAKYRAERFCGAAGARFS